MTLGAGDPRSYRGARFPGIPGFSGLSSQSHGSLKVDRQKDRQQFRSSIPLRFREPAAGLAQAKRDHSRARLSCSFYFVSSCRDRVVPYARRFPSFFSRVLCSAEIQSNLLIVPRRYDGRSSLSILIAGGISRGDQFADSSHGGFSHRRVKMMFTMTRAP